jgi:hypothetical protein
MDQNIQYDEKQERCGKSKRSKRRLEEVEGEVASNT